MKPIYGYSFIELKRVFQVPGSGLLWSLSLGTGFTMTIFGTFH
jgi:hypothetical protein